MRLRARVRATVLPGLESLADADADAAVLIARADRRARELRAELERQPGPLGLGLGVSARPECEDEREWVRGQLHDGALQILEFIAGDGFGTGLSPAKIAGLASRAAGDLRAWIDAVDAPAATDLLPELERVTAEARVLDPCVELVVGRLDAPPTSEQVVALTSAVREAVNNARKHAQASNVIVRVQTNGDGRTAVTVTDDGIGIDPLRAHGGSGFGVNRSIVGRMRRVGGNASLRPAPGRGTCVTLVAGRPAA